MADCRRHVLVGASTIVWGVKRLFRFTLAAGFWTAVALVFALPGLSERPDWSVLLASLAHWWSWGALAPAITAIDDRLPVSTQHRLAAHLGLGVTCVVVYAYLSAYVAAVLGAAAWPRIGDTTILAAAWHEMFWSLLVYGLIVGRGKPTATNNVTSPLSCRWSAWSGVYGCQAQQSADPTGSPLPVQRAQHHLRPGGARAAARQKHD